MDSKKPVGIWIRVSTDDQAMGESPEHHEQRARYYAEAKGWDIRFVYHLEAVSGKSVMNHSETKKMMNDVKTGRITGIIFSKLARLARNTKELLEFADYFREHNADLISLQEAIDTSTPAGRLFYTMIAAMAQWEREEIADRVAASVPVRARLGKSLGGQAAFGYRWEDNEFLLDETEAPVRKMIYELFLKHKRKKTTARELNTMGYRTRNGSKFSDTTIDRLLRDSTAKGERIANHTKSEGGNRNWVPKPESEWVRIPCPAIISVETWAECTRILDEQLQSRRKAGPKPVHLLAGYVFCEVCGKRMYVFHKNNVYACKQCKIRIPAQDLDEIYHVQLKTFLLTESDIETYLKQNNQFIQEKESQLLILKNESVSLKKKMDELVSMRLNGELSKESFPQHYKPLEERLAQIETQIPESEAEIDFLGIQMLSSDTVLREAKDLYERWPTLVYEEKRRIVEVITEAITIGKEEIKFQLAYIPTPYSQNSGKKQHDFKGSWQLSA